MTPALRVRVYTAGPGIRIPFVREFRAWAWIGTSVSVHWDCQTAAADDSETGIAAREVRSLCRPERELDANTLWQSLYVDCRRA